MSKNQDTVRIAYSGAVDREGAPLVPHSVVFSSSMMSLKVLMGLGHDTHLMGAHQTQWRADHDYNLYLGLSGEGFKILFDAAEYFRCDMPEGGGPVRDCFAYTGIPVQIHAQRPLHGVDGTWDSDEKLKALVTGTLRQGFPCILLGSENTERALLAIGYADGGETLVAWTFIPGNDMPNKSFAPEDCQFIGNWWKGTDAALLVSGPPSAPPDREEILLRALGRAAEYLREPGSTPGDGVSNDYGKWIAALEDERYWAGKDTGFRHIYPEIWDLAERRSYAAAFLEQASVILGVDGLKEGIAALNEIHSQMWRIHGLVNGENGEEKLRQQDTRRQIVQIIRKCRSLDHKAADAIEGVLKSWKKK